MYVQVHSNEMEILINLEQVLYITPSNFGTVVYFEKNTIDIDEPFEEVRDLILKKGG